MSHKACIRCKNTQPFRMFSKRKNSADGLDYYCRACKSLYNRERRFEANYDGDKTCTSCSETKPKTSFHRDHRRKDGLEGRCKVCNDKRSRKNEIKRCYGLTLEQYEDLYTAQNNSCAICDTEVPDARTRRLSVDHCHKTSVVRGLLCNNCNNGLGRFKDNVELLHKAIRYLESANGN